MSKESPIQNYLKGRDKEMQNIPDINSYLKGVLSDIRSTILATRKICLTDIRDRSFSGAMLEEIRAQGYGQKQLTTKAIETKYAIAHQLDNIHYILYFESELPPNRRGRILTAETKPSIEVPESFNFDHVPKSLALYFGQLNRFELGLTEINRQVDPWGTIVDLYRQQRRHQPWFLRGYYWPIGINVTRVVGPEGQILDTSLSGTLEAQAMGLLEESIDRKLGPRLILNILTTYSCFWDDKSYQIVSRYRERMKALPK